MGERKLAACTARRRAMRRKAQHRHAHFYERCTHWTFSAPSESTPLQWSHERWVLAGTALLVTLLSVLILPTWANAIKPQPEPPMHALLPLALPKAPTIVQPSPTLEDWRMVQVRPGQSLADIFQARGLGLSDLQRVIEATGSASSALHAIRPGQAFDFLIGPAGNLKGLRFDKDARTRLTVRLDGPKPSLATETRDLEIREHVAHGVIDSSLYAAGAKAGMSAAMVGKLADLFKYDIDFVQNLRDGDSFTAVYEDTYRDGNPYAEGDIVAAEFVTQGHRYTAYRFRKEDGSYGWFSEDGRPIQKSYLRIPVDFTRISSPFSTTRMHPVLGLMRAHKGVDYAAPTDTPIHAAGDGVVKFKGWKTGYGNFVVLQHNGSISTAYGHMSRFGNEHLGQHVHQGEVIGYVGMTGLATGPHLHYEFRVNDVQRDPQTVTLPRPEPMTGPQLARFKSQVVQPQLARLKSLDAQMRLAQTGAAGRNDD